MGEFISEAELHSFLVAINPRYGKYAEALWNHEIRSSAELGNISVTTLVAFGLSNQAHAENVQAFIKQGELQQHAVKRHKTGYTVTPVQVADGAVLWDEEVRGKSVCQILPIGELLQPRQPLLAELRFLSLLHEGWSQDAAPVLKMKSTRQRGQADLEPVYYPHMLQIFQAAAKGQTGIQFLLEDHAALDTARQDLRCVVQDEEGHPGEAKAQNVSSNPLVDPLGIDSNKDAFGKIHKVIRSKFLKAGSNQVFLCPFVVRIECCWIAKFSYQWDAVEGDHHLRSCSVCPPIPGKDFQPAGVLCRNLDDMLEHFHAATTVSLSDLLLMSGDPSPPPGFHMLVQYVATLCHLHSVPIVKPQLCCEDGQLLDISQARILSYGHKSLVVQLGDENFVYKIAQAQLIDNEIMIHRLVDATVPSIIKSDLHAHGRVEGAGSGLRFLKLQLGTELRTCPEGMLHQHWRCALEAVTGLHEVGVLHRDIKPENMLCVNCQLCLNDFDVSCFSSSLDATLRSRVGTEAFRSPHWQVGQPYEALDDLASLLLAFASLLSVRQGSAIEQIQYLSVLPNAPASMKDISQHVLSHM